MNFLVDAQLPARLARALAVAGHDAIHTSDLPEGNRSTDGDIARRADTENRVVVTKDRDFRDGHLLTGSPRRLLVVATGNITNNALMALFASRSLRRSTQGYERSPHSTTPTLSSLAPPHLLSIVAIRASLNSRRHSSRMPATGRRRSPCRTDERRIQNASVMVASGDRLRHQVQPRRPDTGLPSRSRCPRNPTALQMTANVTHQRSSASRSSARVRAALRSPIISFAQERSEDGKLWSLRQRCS